MLPEADKTSSNTPDNDLIPEPENKIEPNNVKTKNYNLRKNIKPPKKLDL